MINLYQKYILTIKRKKKKQSTGEYDMMFIWVFWMWVGDFDGFLAIKNSMNGSFYSPLN